MGNQDHAGMTNAPFLPLAELFGSRDQFWDISQTIVPVKSIDGDALVNGVLVGADGTSALTAAGATGTAAVTSLHDCYLTGLFVIEPLVTVANTVLPFNFAHLRNLGGTLTQVSYLQAKAPVEFIGSIYMGLTGATGRIYRLEGIPYGTLIRAGDVFSCNFLNAGAAVLTSGMTIGYRGFQGPPA